MHSNIDHTVLSANNTISAFTRKHFPGVTTTHICTAKAWMQLTTHLSTPRGWMAELAMLADIQRSVYPEKVTRQLHVMVQARERSPVIDRHSDHWIRLYWIKHTSSVPTMYFCLIKLLKIPNFCKMLKFMPLLKIHFNLNSIFSELNFYPWNCQPQRTEHINRETKDEDKCFVAKVQTSSDTEAV